MLGAPMPSLEKHEGWGNRVLVLHEGKTGPARYGLTADQGNGTAAVAWLEYELSTPEASTAVVT